MPGAAARFIFNLNKKNRMKKSAIALFIAAAMAAAYGFTVKEHPVEAHRVALQPIKIGTAIGDEAPDIVIAVS